MSGHDHDHAHAVRLDTERPDPEWERLLVGGAVMGAASLGVVLADAEVRRVFRSSTPEEPFQARLAALVRVRAREQGVAVPAPLLEAP